MKMVEFWARQCREDSERGEERASKAGVRGITERAPVKKKKKILPYTRFLMLKMSEYSMSQVNFVKFYIVATCNDI